MKAPPKRLSQNHINRICGLRVAFGLHVVATKVNSNENHILFESLPSAVRVLVLINFFNPYIVANAIF